jgi:hypothetical protein
VRRLVILCEAVHGSAVWQTVSRCAHPQLKDRLVDVVVVERSEVIDRDRENRRVISLMSTQLGPTETDKPLLCATRELAFALNLRALAAAMQYELETVTAPALCASATTGHGKASVLARLLNRCELALRPAATKLLQPWSHAAINRTTVDDWMNQFGRLGPFTWVAEAILSELHILGAPDLSASLVSLGVHHGATICVNADARNHGKSGQVIANLLSKAIGADVIDSPTRSIEEVGASRVVVYEDGLWSGTEAIGVVESLLGEREKARLKTQPLADPTKLKHVELVLAYGFSTDYGEALVRQALAARGLASNVKIVSAQTISVASDSFLSEIKNGEHDPRQLWSLGPPNGAVRPHWDSRLRARAVDRASDLPAGLKFSREVGQQLFDVYLRSMQLPPRSWSPWPDEKRLKCSLGMYGLGLLHAFSHSVPKATLPLLWASGPVSYQGRTFEWKPLFANAVTS